MRYPTSARKTGSEVIARALMLPVQNATTYSGTETIASQPSVRAQSPGSAPASSPNMSRHSARTASVIQPSVPAWTCVRRVFRSNVTRSSPLRIPTTIVSTNTAIAAANRARSSVPGAPRSRVPSITSLPWVVFSAPPDGPTR